MMQCGMEVVLANGDVYRTGMGGVPGSNTWQIFKWGYGPTLDGMFTQANYGICTKMGFWLMPKPPVSKPFEVIFENEEDIVEIVDLLRPLRMSGTIPNSVVIASTLWEAGSAHLTRAQYVSEPGHTPDSVIRQMQKDTGMGAWNLYAALYGTREQVDVNWKIVTDAFRKLGKGASSPRKKRETNSHSSTAPNSCPACPICRNSACTTGVAAAARCGLRQ